MNASITWNALTSILVDSINARSSVAARITVALVDVDFTVCSRSSRQATASVASNEILTMAIVLARIRFTFIDLGLAEVSGVSSIALACEGVVSVNTGSTMAWI
jgi:hypothetical protein